MRVKAKTSPESIVRYIKRKTRRKFTKALLQAGRQPCYCNLLHLYSCNGLREGLGRVVQLGLFHKRLPLDFLHSVISERILKDCGFNRDFRLSILECFPDGSGQNLALIIKLFGEQPDVVEVLHPAVQNSELHHGLELFCDGTLHAVAFQLRSRKIKNRRVYNFRGLRYNHIAESGVNL